MSLDFSLNLVLQREIGRVGNTGLRFDSKPSGREIHVNFSSYKASQSRRRISKVVSRITNTNVSAI